MFEIELGLLVVDYLVGDEQVPSDRQSAAGFEARDDFLLQKCPSVRRLFVRLPRGRNVYMILHWSDGTNLIEVDEVVAAGMTNTRIFDGALAGSLMTVKCASCLARYRAIVADTGNAMFDNLPERLRLHSYVSMCPKCGQKMPPHVMELIREF